MKSNNKNWKQVLVFIVILIATATTTFIIYGFKSKQGHCHKTVMAMQKSPQLTSKNCVFNTLMGEIPLDSSFILETTDDVEDAIKDGLQWIRQAQHPNGGWGAGSHARQDITDPLAVNPDPATTSMVGMALLRCNNTLESGIYKAELNKALNYILETIESLSNKEIYITDEQNTQIQRKLGVHIDAVLSSQFLTNLANKLDETHPQKGRITNAIKECVKRIQKAQNTDGSLSGEGWAGVLQSSYANNALEAAQSLGIAVDSVAFNKSKTYQMDNYDASTGDVKTDKGAGIMLYSVSGSTRASAKDARKAREVIDQAKKEGKLKIDEAVSVDNLKKIGLSDEEALSYGTAYDVYESANEMAVRSDVTSGFGNNGGEEFISFLQTGESMIINKDMSWKNWYATTSGNLLNIQNSDGSWNGHHCITSPVFCTATCLLVLSVNNDIEELVALGFD